MSTNHTIVGQDMLVHNNIRVGRSEQSRLVNRKQAFYLLRFAPARVYSEAGDSFLLYLLHDTCLH